jgi:hypothetical protein
MPRFHFDIDDGDGVFRDDEGCHLDTVDNAGREAARTLAEMVRSALDRTTRPDMTIDVRDECGSPVLRARLTLAIELLN